MKFVLRNFLNTRFITETEHFGKRTGRSTNMCTNARPVNRLDSEPHYRRTETLHKRFYISKEEVDDDLSVCVLNLPLI